MKKRLKDYLIHDQLLFLCFLANSNVYVEGFVLLETLRFTSLASATGSYIEDDTIDTSAAAESGNCLFYPCKCSEFSHSSAISGTICVYRYNRTQVCQRY